MDETTHFIDYELEHMMPCLHEKTSGICKGISQIEDTFGGGCDQPDCEDEQCMISTPNWYGEEIAHFISADIMEIIFQSWEEAETFYLQFSKQVGFGIRKRDSQKNKVGNFRRMKWVCRKEGVRDQGRIEGSSSSKSEPRAETRVNCMAHFIVKLKKKTGMWVV